MCCLSGVDLNHARIMLPHSKYVAMIICTDHAEWSCQILMYNNLPSMHALQNGRHVHRVTQWSKRKTVPPKFLEVTKNVILLWLHVKKWHMAAKKVGCRLHYEKVIGSNLPVPAGSVLTHKVFPHGCVTATCNHEGEICNAVVKVFDSCASDSGLILRWWSTGSIITAARSPLLKFQWATCSGWQKTSQLVVL